MLKYDLDVADIVWATELDSTASAGAPVIDRWGQVLFRYVGYRLYIALVYVQCISCCVGNAIPISCCVGNAIPISCCVGNAIPKGRFLPFLEDDFVFRGRDRFIRGILL